MAVNPQIFRAYDIRGLVGSDLTFESVTAIGKAFGSYMRRDGKTQLVVGRDGRLSSPEYAGWIIDALRSTGCDVIDIGLVPTPAFYFAVIQLKRQGGIMVTASHNPPEFNGFKLGLDRATLYGEQIQEILRIAQSGSFATGAGTLESHDILPEYIDYLASVLKPSTTFPIATDCGNGAGGLVAPALFKRLGFPVTELFTEVDGTFPNHHPDPTVIENLGDLVETIKSKGLRVGLAYDGDSDRLGVIDADGTMVWGDQLMILFARQVLETNPGATVIMEVKSSQTLFDDIAKHGGRPIVWKTGHSNIKQKMKEEHALLAGEMSGHLFFADRYFGFDDAIYASGRLLEILASTGKTIRELLADVPKTFTTPEIRVDCPDDVKFGLVDELTALLKKDYPVIDIDGVRVVFPEGWGLVRASNTQPALVLRFEAQSKEQLREYRRVLVSLLRGRVELPAELTEGL
jgi:phosphomannomutase/phosphoglucomutase